MKNVNVIDIKPKRITDFFMIKATSIKVSSNGRSIKMWCPPMTRGPLRQGVGHVDENNINF